MAETQTSVSSPRLRDEQNYEDASPSQIKADIDQTRAEMDRTIDRLGAELEPRRIMEEIMNAFNINGRDMAHQARNVARDTGQALWTSIRENPVPLALVGLGIGWLAYNQYKDKGESSGSESMMDRVSRRFQISRRFQRRRHPVGESYSAVDTRTGEPYSASYGQEFAGESSQSGGSEEGMSEKLSHMGEQMKDKGKSMISGAREKLSQLGQKLSGSGGEGEGQFSQAGERLSQVRDRVGEKMHQAGEQFSQGREVASKTLRDYPLAAGGIAMLLGVAVGAMLPRTRRENRLMGESADELKRKASVRAREMSHEFIDRGKEVVETGVEAASDEAQRQAEDLRHRASE